MKTVSKTALLAAGMLSLALIQGCATKIKASSNTNPPPAEAFSAYGRIEVKPVVFKPGYKSDAAGRPRLMKTSRRI